MLPARPPLLVSLLLCVLAVLVPGRAAANPVNAEKLLSDPSKDGWSGSLSTSLALSRGNVQRLDFSLGGGVQYWTLYPHGVGYRRRPAPEGAPPFFRDRWVLVANGSFIRVALREVANSGFTHMRYTRMWLPRLGSEVFVQGQYNEMTLLRSRALAGLGVRFDPVHERVIQIWGGTGYMAERESIDTAPEDPHPALAVNHRWTNYAVVQLRLFDSAVVVRNTLYAQPRFDAFRDFRLLETLQIEARVAPILAFGVEFEAQHDNRPPLTVMPTDLHVRSYLRLTAPSS